MKTDVVTVCGVDNHTFDCVIESPEHEPVGAIVVLQEIFGVTQQLKNIAKTYAELGYIVAIPALFDRQGKDLVIPFAEGSKAKALMEAANLDHAMADIESTVSVMRENSDTVAVMGFCWGGGLALRCAQKLDISGSIIFYGTRMTNYLDGPLKSPVLGHFGSDDAHVPSSDLVEVQRYFPDMQMHTYKAGHAFANDSREQYVATAATLAHQRNEAFLRTILS